MIEPQYWFTSPNESREKLGLEPISQRIELRSYEDGRVVLLHNWPPKAMMTTTLFEMGFQTLIRRIEDHVFFSLANAQASYRITHEDAEQGLLWIEYVSGNFSAE